MKSLTPNLSRAQLAGFALALAVFSPSLFAEDPVTGADAAGNKAADKASSKIDDYRTNNSDVNKAEVKAALAAVDAELDHLARLADSAPTPEMKADANARYKVLKERRKELGSNFTSARYAAFKADVKTETDKLSNWTKETFHSKPSASSAASATASAADKTADKITDYRVDSSDLNKAEVKAAMTKLDADIDLLEAKIDAVQDPVRKDELKQHLSVLKDRRDELRSEFRKARYDALTADVKAEWRKLTN
jgi:DNA repair exonuclease SbcCD ATPase subunit